MSHPEAPEGDPSEKLSYYFARHFQLAIQLGTALKISASVVPTLLAEYDAHPDRPVSEIMKSLGEKIRTGELDSREV